VRKFHTRIGGDLGDQSMEHLVEQLDVFVTQSARAACKQRADATERVRAARRGAMPDDVLQF
jgi:hypothetical protein